MPLGDHLDELRYRIILSLLAVVVATVLCFVWTDRVIAFLIRPAIVVFQRYNMEPSLLSLSPPDAFLVYIKMSILCGVILASPIVIWQVWMFVSSGLYERERRVARRSILPSIALFATGVLFMFFIVLPLVLNFFAQFSRGFQAPEGKYSWFERQLFGVEEVSDLPEDFIPQSIPVLQNDPKEPAPGTIWFNESIDQLKLVKPSGEVVVFRGTAARNLSSVTNQYSIDYYVSFVLRLALAFGIAFQMPIVVLALALSGLVSLVQFRKARRYVILGLVIVAAVLTPPDVVSQILLAIPMLVLYEAGILVAGMMKKHK